MISCCLTARHGLSTRNCALECELSDEHGFDPPSGQVLKTAEITSGPTEPSLMKAEVRRFTASAMENHVLPRPGLEKVCDPAIQDRRSIGRPSRSNGLKGGVVIGKKFQVSVVMVVLRTFSGRL